MTRYLKVLKPITSDEQYENAERLVKNFLADGGDGENLQNKLKDFAETTDNWVGLLFGPPSDPLDCYCYCYFGREVGREVNKAKAIVSPVCIFTLEGFSC